jgi:hypothetical protein
MATQHTTVDSHCMPLTFHPSHWPINVCDAYYLIDRSIDQLIDCYAVVRLCVPSRHTSSSVSSFPTTSLSPEDMQFYFAMRHVAAFGQATPVHSLPTLLSGLRCSGAQWATTCQADAAAAHATGVATHQAALQGSDAGVLGADGDNSATGTHTTAAEPPPPLQHLPAPVAAQVPVTPASSGSGGDMALYGPSAALLLPYSDAPAAVQRLALAAGTPG